jgi:DNA-binding NarL/FixJ family response regulator
MGFVPKRSSNAELFDALRMVMSGGIFVPSMALGSITPESIEQRRNDPDAQAAVSGVGVAAAGSGHQTQTPLARLGLTPRQTDVLALLLKGQPNKLIARELKLSVETVKDHVAAVLRALNVNSRTQAVLAVGQMQQQPGGLHDWHNRQS